MPGKIFYHKEIRLRLLTGLVFCFLLTACSEKGNDSSVSIVWDDNKAIGIRIPYSLLKGMSYKSARKLVKVQLEDSDADILGEYSNTDRAIIFQPLIPFTAGSTYEVLASGTPVYRISIPFDRTASPSSVSAVYPRASEVPENLLKMYIHFTRPMQEGRALENIYMIRNEKDTIDVFLDLQQELWNKERTILTVWLDPGRIKRGLQPNEKTGIPLRQGEKYQLIIDRKWKNVEGLELLTDYSKAFTVGARDSVLPSIDRWEILSPKAGDYGELIIKLPEPLDYLLLKNTTRILDSEGNQIAGFVEVFSDDTEFSFFRDIPWKKGTYTIEVESRLEDLAGNNLNRPFDRDISNKNTPGQKPIHKRSFRIE